MIVHLTAEAESDLEQIGDYDAKAYATWLSTQTGKTPPAQ